VLRVRSVATFQLLSEPNVDSSVPPVKSARSRQLDAMKWAFFLIWIGVAVLANLGWGWALLDMTSIILGAQEAVGIV
jgi:hypothetical protein